MLASFNVLGQLRGAQKFVLLRIFVVINIGAYFLATGSYFDNAWADAATPLVVYALESGFMLWLGFKRGVGFHRNLLGTSVATVPLVRKGPGAAWYIGVLVLSLLITTMVAIVVTSMGDSGGMTTMRAAIFLIVEAIVMGFSLLQGLRLGWSALAASSDAVVPARVQENASSMDASAPLRVASPSIEEQDKARTRAANIRRGQIALGCISVICAGLAIYFHVVAHEMAKPDPDNDAAIQAVVQGLGDGAAPRGNAAQATGQEAMPPDDPSMSSVLAKAAQVAAETGTAQDLGAFPFPVAAGTRSPDGYPVYLLECNVEANTCVGGEGQAYGTIAKTADQLTPIRNIDAMRYKCIQRVCIDTSGNYVGAISSVMQAYWEAHNAPLHEFGK